MERWTIPKLFPRQNKQKITQLDTGLHNKGLVYAQRFANRIIQQWYTTFTGKSSLEELYLTSAIRIFCQYNWVCPKNFAGLVALVNVVIFFILPAVCQFTLSTKHCLLNFCSVKQDSAPLLPLTTIHFTILPVFMNKRMSGTDTMTSLARTGKFYGYWLRAQSGATKW